MKSEDALNSREDNSSHDSEGSETRLSAIIFSNRLEVWSVKKVSTNFHVDQVGKLRISRAAEEAVVLTQEGISVLERRKLISEIVSKFCTARLIVLTNKE